MTNPSEIIHATTVSLSGQGMLILGPSGSGKSSLALQLISLGARLVADDRTRVERSGQRVIATVPGAIAGMIEARGVGILKLDAAGPTALNLVVDLSRAEHQRLPEPHHYDLLGVTLPCLHNAPSPHFAAALLLYLGKGISSGS